MLGDKKRSAVKRSVFRFCNVEVYYFTSTLLTLLP